MKVYLLKEHTRQSYPFYFVLGVFEKRKDAKDAMEVLKLTFALEHHVSTLSIEPRELGKY